AAPVAASTPVDLFAQTDVGDATPQGEQAGEAWIQALLALPADSPEFRKQVDRLMRLGRKESDELVRASSILLQQNVGTPQGGSEAQMRVSESLTALRQQIDRINPSHAYARFHDTPVLKWFVFQGVRPEYVNDFKDAQGHIRNIAMDLYRGQDCLRHDNIVLDQQQKTVQSLTQGLRQATALASGADSELTRQIERLRMTDPERADALSNQVQFYVRQKLQDLTTQEAVNTQADLVYGLIRNNNVELLRQVERATQITLAALQVGVTASVALAHQKGVLKQAQDMTRAAGEVVTSTADSLRSESDALQQAPRVNPEALKQQLGEVYASLDQADAAKARSVEAMEKALQTLHEVRR
ncbi:MAG: toxic anion resistance protein, partial [Candidatus Xenobia bacterium]